MARRPHPYYGQLNRLEEARKAAPGKGRRKPPAASPGTEPGILWDSFREPSEELAESE